MRARLGAALALALAPALGHAAPPERPLPAQLGATLVIEPPRIEVGDPFEVEIAVVTPPDHAVAPAPVPKATPGLWILDAERPVVERQPGRWVHRQRFRARARATGELVWPALELGVEGPDGAKTSVQVPARPFVVRSLLDDHPERRSFFSYRAPSGLEGGRGPWLPALVGALFALAGVGLVAWVRHARAAAAAAAGARAAAPALASGESATLDALRHAAAASDPVRAADLGAAALRDWAAERARTPSLRAATSEELARRAAPFLIAPRWPRFVALVAELDALRFPPPREDAAARVRDALARAGELVGPPA
jgi:hypothetical protein